MGLSQYLIEEERDLDEKSRILRETWQKATGLLFYEGRMYKHGAADAKLVNPESGEVLLAGRFNPQLMVLPNPTFHSSLMIDRLFLNENQELSFKIGAISAKMSLFCEKLNITSMKGFPSSVNGLVALRNCPSLTSYEHMPAKITGRVHLGINVPLTRFNAHLKECTGPIYLLQECYSGSPLLSLLLIKGLIGVRRQSTGFEPSNDPRLFNAVEIVNRHVNGEKDVLECQEELIKAGLKEYARL